MTNNSNVEYKRISKLKWLDELRRNLERKIEQQEMMGEGERKKLLQRQQKVGRFSEHPHLSIVLTDDKNVKCD